MTAPDPARLQLRCRGLVQGVGFRPLVHVLAKELDLTGRLENQTGCVLLDLHGERHQLQRFHDQLPHRLKAPARLDHLETSWLPPQQPRPADLRIATSIPRVLGQGLVAQALSPDLAACAACRAELADPGNRRYRYPFISCSHCGPRYAIATAEPFARAHTTMARFPLCAACRAEFETPDQRRFHAETISCPACGPRLHLVDANGAALMQTGAAGDPQDPISAAVALLCQGRILALQGVGGFQLLVEAKNLAAVKRLRRRKQRPSKPFALLVDQIGRIAPFVHLNRAERRQLMGAPAPIVLLRRRRMPANDDDPVAPGSPWLGVMLPASPLHQLLVEAVAAPLVATSGNRSGESICSDPDEARERLGSIADAFLIHDRPIARPLDDSLLRVVEGRPMLLRRARGYAPAPLEPPAIAPNGRCLLALGADLKSAPLLSCGQRLWPSPYRGDLAEARQFAAIQQGLSDLIVRCASDLEAIACDAHPGYVSHQLAADLASRHQLPLLPIEHHPAHALAVVAEHGLLSAQTCEPVLVWAADGLGYGVSPPHLRGGELLLIQSGAPPQHLAGLRPFPLPGADAALRDGRRCALGLLTEAGLEHHPGAAPLLARWFPDALPLLLQALNSGLQAPPCTSLGRLFDGLAALVAGIGLQSFEGEAGLQLEGLAHRSETDGNDSRSLPPLRLELTDDLPLGRLNWQPLLEGVLSALATDQTAAIAVGCHRAIAAGLVRASVDAARQHRCRRVALSGGCFQNGLLLQLCIEGLRREDLIVHWPEQLPCNDGGLALGQLWAAELAVSITRPGDVSTPCAWPPPA